MRYAFILIAFALITGCHEVYSPVPVGEEPANIDSSKAEWEGTWINPDGAMVISVKDGLHGILTIGSLNIIDSGRLKPEIKSVWLRNSGNWTFASFESDDPSKEKRFLWGRMVKRKNEIIFWLPKAEKFKGLVTERILPGNITEDDDVMLGTLTSDHLKMITSEAKGVLFEWDNPLVLTRIRD